MIIRPSINVYNPVTAVIPVVFILLVGLVKDGYEDYIHHKTDKKVNERPVHVIRDNKLQTIQLQQIYPGDFVLVKRYILLFSSYYLH